MNRFILLLWLAVCAAAAPGPLRFRVTLDPSLGSQTVSGRMLVFLSDRPDKQSRLQSSNSPGGAWVSAMEVDALKPGQAFDFNPDLTAFPKPFTSAPKGKLQFMALLDLDHSYAYSGPGAGDLTSTVVQVDDLDPTLTEPVELVLTERRPSRFDFKETDSLKLIEFESPMLSEFWGRPVIMHAAVLLPPSYVSEPESRFPVSYIVHGFGGNHLGALRMAPRVQKDMLDGKRPNMVRVYLDASSATGHHVFADSVNNGPWGAALTRELIPHLEKKFRLDPKPAARFLTGHSSGGWTTLWLQVTYPDVFGGTWSTAPDPVDFRSFTGVNASVGSTDNAYLERDGSKKMLIRRQGKFVTSLEDFTRLEEVLGPVGGQMASFDWAFSPRGYDGRPMKLFNRTTGELDPFVAKAWEKYDIRLILERNWATLGPKLQGRLHITCGSMDTFRLEEAVYLLCDLLKSKGREDACEIVPGRDHSNLSQPYTTYPDGLAVRIENEMMAAYERSRVPAKQITRTTSK